MSALYATALNTFKEMGWLYLEVPEHAVIEANFEAHHTKIPLHVQVFGETNIITVVSNSTLQVPSSHRLPVCELLMRTNKDLNLGNFELEWESGQVMFRVTNVFPPNRHDARIIASLVHSAVAEMDRLTPFLGEIIHTPKGELLLLKVADLMKREDLLPPAPDAE